jgi:hypothetical protein
MSPTSTSSHVLRFCVDGEAVTVLTMRLDGCLVEDLRVLLPDFRFIGAFLLDLDFFLLVFMA